MLLLLPALHKIHKNAHKMNFYEPFFSLFKVFYDLYKKM